MMEGSFQPKNAPSLVLPHVDEDYFFSVVVRDGTAGAAALDDEDNFVASKVGGYGNASSCPPCAASSGHVVDGGASSGSDRVPHLHWALHHGPSNGCKPVLFWKTPLFGGTEKINCAKQGKQPGSALKNAHEESHSILSRVFSSIGGNAGVRTGRTKTEKRSHPPPREPIEDLATLLRRHIPQVAQKVVFADDTQCEEDSAHKGKKLVVYADAPSHMTDQVEHIRTLWERSVPSIVVGLTPDYFLWGDADCPEEKATGLGVDQLAALRGAGLLYGYPSLVLDVGPMAMSYAAADSSGNVLGGGRGPGLSLKLQAYLKHHQYFRESDSSDARAAAPAPLFDVEAILPMLLEEAVIPRYGPLSTFAHDERESLLADALGELASKSRRVVSCWMDQVGKPTKKRKSDTNHNSMTESSDTATSLISPVPGANESRKVIISGADGCILLKLLQKGSSIIESTHETKFKSCVIMFNKYLLHYGITAAIMRCFRPVEERTESNQGDAAKRCKTNSRDNAGVSLVNRRVAKMFPATDNNKKEDVYRGTIAKVEHASSDAEDGETDDWFFIEYDDGDTEHVALGELQSMLSLYDQVGEQSDN